MDTIHLWVCNTGGSPVLKIMNQNMFLFVQENQVSNYSKKGGDRISVTRCPVGKTIPKPKTAT
jgi:hypothetical protein